MKFSQDFIEKVRDANNVVNVISDFTELKRSGDRLTGLCPFPDHNEKTPSFSVSESKQLYHCFGCKKSGNIYNFLGDIRGLSFPESVEFLAGKAGLEIPQEFVANTSSSSSREKELRKTLWKLNRYAMSYFHSNLTALPADNEVIKYCALRGITPAIIRNFKIGVSFDDWEGLTNYLTTHKAPLDLAAQVGLIKKRDSGKSGHYDIFRHRLIFPIESQASEVIGFGGRVLGDGQPKYLNSPESAVFNKRKTFYGLNETAKYISTEGSVIVVEGYMDLIALYSAGIKNVVATLGTALTSEHAHLIKRYTKNIIVLFDGDSAGQTAAERSLPILLREGLYPRGYTLPDKMDPDDYIKKFGAEDLKQKLDSSKELFTIVMNKHLVNYSGAAADKIRLIDEMAPILASVADPRLKDLYIKQVAEYIGESAKWVQRALVAGKVPQKAAPRAAEPELAKTPRHDVIDSVDLIKVSKAPRAEVFLVNLALKYQELFKEVFEDGIEDKITNPGYRQILDLAKEASRQMPKEFDKLTALLASQVEPARAVTQYMDKPMSEMDLESSKRLFADCKRKILESHLRKEQKELTHGLRSKTALEQQEQLERIMNIQKNRKALLKGNGPL